MVTPCTPLRWPSSGRNSGRRAKHLSCQDSHPVLPKSQVDSQETTLSTSSTSGDEVISSITSELPVPLRRPTGTEAYRHLPSFRSISVTVCNFHKLLTIGSRVEDVYLMVRSVRPSVLYRKSYCK